VVGVHLFIVNTFVYIIANTNSLPSAPYFQIFDFWFQKVGE